ALAGGTLSHQVYSVLFMKWGVFNWHFALSRLLLCVLVPGAIDRVLVLRSPVVARRLAVLGSSALLLATVWLVYRRDWGEVVQLSWRGQAYDLAIWADEHLPPDAILANSDCGYIGLFSGRRVINLDGIINGYEYQSALRDGRFVEYLQRMGVTHFVGSNFLLV